MTTQPDIKYICSDEVFAEITSPMGVGFKMLPDGSVLFPSVRDLKKYVAEFQGSLIQRIAVLEANRASD